MILLIKKTNIEIEAWAWGHWVEACARYSSTRSISSTKLSSSLEPFFLQTKNFSSESKTLWTFDPFVDRRKMILISLKIVDGNDDDDDDDGDDNGVDDSDATTS